MIPVVLITGFLGSGKTTLLQRLLRGREEGNIGVLVNDFGPVAVDLQLIKSTESDENLQIYEISNGSVFCSCNRAGFILGLKTLALKNPGILYIETSGMSDPTGFQDLLDSHGFHETYTIRSVLTVIDPLKTPKLLHVLPAVEAQITAATDIVLNKTDLVPGAVSEKEYESFIGVLRSLNPDAVLHPSVYCDIDIHSIAERKHPDGQTQPYLVQTVAQNSNTPSNRPGCAVLTGEVSDINALHAYFSAIDGLYYRAKGFLSVGGTLHYVSDSGGRIEAEPWDKGPPQTEPALTVICPPEHTPAIEDAWTQLVPA